MNKLLDKAMILDLETLGLKSYCGIVEIGFLLIENMDIKQSYSTALKPHSDSTRMDQTMLWWTTNPKRFKYLNLLEHKMLQFDTAEKLAFITDIIDSFNPKVVLSWRGVDAGWLRDTYELYEVQAPKVIARFTQSKDAETLCYYHNIKKKQGDHTALNDCYDVYNALRQIFL